MASVASRPTARRTRRAKAIATEPGPAGDVERDIRGRRPRRLHQQIERGLVVQGRRGRELRGLALNVVGDGRVMRRDGGAAGNGLGHRCGPSGNEIAGTGPGPCVLGGCGVQFAARVGLSPYDPVEGTPLELPAF